MAKPKMLILCTGNSARSQMAEAFMRRYVGDQFDVYSAGLEPKGLNPLTVRVMEEIGYDLSRARSKDVFEFLGHYNFGVIITVCANAEARCPIFPGVSQRLHWPFEDPAAVEGTEEEKLAVFRCVRDEIGARVRDWAAAEGYQPMQAGEVPDGGV